MWKVLILTKLSARRLVLHAACAAIAVASFAAQGLCVNPLGVPDSEYEALVELYNSTDGPNWADNTNWLTSRTPWHGVIVSGGHVTWVDLYSNDLNGTIPAKIGQLEYLQHLWLDSNQLTGAIPVQVASLQALRYLWLDSNQLSGPVPAELGNLSNLQSIRLNNNELTGEIPSELGNLSKLQSLYLLGNQLTGTIPAALGSLTNLNWLYLADNRLSGTVPSSLGNLAELRYLSLDGNRLVGEIPASFVNLDKLISGGSMLGYNALFTSDTEVGAVLDAAAPGWRATQTLAPSDVAAVVVAPGSIVVSWEPISYTTDNGYYEVGSSATPGGPYTFLPENRTANKSAVALNPVNLPDGHTYLVVRTVTQQHANNPKNVVESLLSDEVVPDVPVMPKSVADGSAVVATGVVSAVFPEFFYIESSDRSWGIRVVSAASLPSSGEVVVHGIVKTGANGERYLEASRVYEIGPAAVAPLAVTNRSLGGDDWQYDAETGAGQLGVKGCVGSNTIGLLVVAYGRVTASTDDWFYIDDGTEALDGSGNRGIRVSAAGINAPPEGSYVSVTGVSSCRYQGVDLVNLLLPRTQSDITDRDP